MATAIVGQDSSLYPPSKQEGIYCPEQQEVWRRGGSRVGEIQQLNTWSRIQLVVLSLQTQGQTGYPTRPDRVHHKKGTVSPSLIFLRRKTPFQEIPLHTALRHSLARPGLRIAPANWR